MIEKSFFKKVDFSACRTAEFVLRADIYTVKLYVYNRAGAHCARFERDKQITADKIFIVKFSARALYRENFRVV